jgi:hypothetical protein
LLLFDKLVSNRLIVYFKHSLPCDRAKLWF